MEPWAVFTLTVIGVLLGFWSGWMFAVGQMNARYKGTDLADIRNRSDEASPDILMDDHFGVRLTPGEHLAAVAHARKDMVSGGDWSCNCPNCFKVRAKFAERGRLTIYTRSLSRAFNRG